jgi:hypothetical protein
LPKTSKKKPLLIVRFADETIFIFQPVDDHVPNRHYKEEAVGFLGRLLKRKSPQVQCFKEEASKKLREIVGFKDPDLIQAFPEFPKDGVEWHPIVLRLDMYMLSQDFVPHLKKGAAKRLEKLEGHPLEANIRKALKLSPSVAV